MNKNSCHVEIKSTAGVHSKRNSTNLQKYEEGKLQEIKANSGRETSLGASDAGQGKSSNLHVTATR